MLNDLTNELKISIDLAGGLAAGYVVIDTAINGTSSGGVRVAADLSADEISALAREMTLKFSFIGLPRGGAKSGVRMPAAATAQEKREILGEFGRKLGPLIRTGLYYPGMDMNCGPDDLRAIYRGAGILLPDKTTDTSYYTAVSVANAIHACVSDSLSANRPLTVAIEGFGSVGCCLARRLPAAQFRIVALSTIRGAVTCREGFAPEVLADVRSRCGDDLVNHLPGSHKVEAVAVLTADVDILVPAARTWSIHADNVSDIRARVIVPAANVPYTAEAVNNLHDRGILALPGFVTNSGGVYASSLFDSGVSIGRIEDISSRYYRPVVAALLKKSLELGQPPVAVAERIALQRLQARVRGDGGDGRFDRLLKRLFRKGLLPRVVYGRRASQVFVENLQNLALQVLETDAC